MDCRVIPDYDIEKVFEFAKEIAEKHAGVSVEYLQKESSPPTPEDSEVVRKLSKAIETVRGIKPTVHGIGGNTCAAFFRKAGFHTAVWSTVDGTAHQPNEYAVIDNIVEDAKVFAVLPFL
jgi:succinyl-diaminopimelate desuccinylase